MPEIFLHESTGADYEKFNSQHTVDVKITDTQRLVTISGNALIEAKGTVPDKEWVDYAVRLGIQVRLRHKFEPTTHEFRIDQAAPFMTLNAWRNDGPSHEAGWRLNSFKGPGRGQTRKYIDLYAHMSVRDRDGFILALGYTVTLLGEVVHSPLSPPL